MKGLIRWMAVLGMVVVGLMAVVPHAQAISFNLTSDHCTGGCGTPPFGVVDVTQNGANVDITVTLFDGNLFAKTQAGDNQAFKFNGTGVALTDITVDPHSPVLIAQTGSFSGDGTGPFTFGIFCSSCSMGASGAFAGPISFHVANATIADLTTPNVPQGNVFVADILSGTTGNTGPVDASTPNGVTPEPASLLLIGSGMALAGMLRKRWTSRP